MRVAHALAVGLSLLAGGCGRSPADHAAHFTGKALPRGEALVKKYYAPTGALRWSAVERRPEFRETHFLGMPMSKGDGERLSCEARAGKRVYRVEAHYTGRGTVLVRVSVTDGAGYDAGADPALVLRRLGVAPGLRAVFGSRRGSVRYDGKEFSLTQGLRGGKRVTELECSESMPR